MSNLKSPNEAMLRSLIEQIADQLCLTVGRKFDFLITIDGEDDTAEKLQMLTNFVLATARRSIEEVQRVKEALHQALEERQRVETAKALGPMVGKSPAQKKVWQQIELVAPTDASVLIVGESGTGKELVARAIHAQSQRQNQPLVTINCASIPRELFESEFFGHLKGAFTGAVQDRVGRVELAHGGTLFLDEVAEIPSVSNRRPSQPVSKPWDSSARSLHLLPARDAGKPTGRLQRLPPAGPALTCFLNSYPPLSPPVYLPRRFGR
jgi:transcriptional regulator with PAS, ATPase and Fis domain